jgi:hypothetical protein
VWSRGKAGDNIKRLPIANPSLYIFRKEINMSDIEFLDDVSIKIYFDKTQMTLDTVQECLKDLLCFTPNKMMIKDYKRNLPVRYSNNSFIALLKILIKEDVFSAKVIEDNDNINQMLFRKSKNFALISLIVANETYRENESNLQLKLNELFSKLNGVVGYTCSLKDNYWQNNNDLQQYILDGKPLEQLVIKQHRKLKSRQVVDVEYHPGHSHYVMDLWFGSC